MAKLQGHDCKMNHVMGPELQWLFYRRARAKYKEDLYVEYVTPVLGAGPRKTNSLVSRIDDSIKETGIIFGGFQVDT